MSDDDQWFSDRALAKNVVHLNMRRPLTAQEEADGYRALCRAQADIISSLRDRLALHETPAAQSESAPAPESKDAADE